MLRFIIWRLELSDDASGGLKLTDSVQTADRVRKSSFTVSQEMEKLDIVSSRRGSTATSYRPPSNPTSTDNTPDQPKKSLSSITAEDISTSREAPEILEPRTIKPFQQHEEKSVVDEEESEVKAVTMRWAILADQRSALIFLFAKCCCKSEGRF